jgi:hypothetical protein
MAQKKSNKENKDDMKLCIKNNAKRYGYKLNMGHPYKVVNNFIYELSIIVDYAIYISIKYKPIILDKILGEILNTVDVRILEVEKSKNSIRMIHGAKQIEIEYFIFYCDDNENVETIFAKIINYSNKIIEEHSAKVKSIEIFYESILKDDSQYLNVILADMLNNNYEKALIKINECIKENKSGGFLLQYGESIWNLIKKKSDGFGVEVGIVGRKSIIEYAKEYCEKKMGS